MLGQFTQLSTVYGAGDYVSPARAALFAYGRVFLAVETGATGVFSSIAVTVVAGGCCNFEGAKMRNIGKRVNRGRHTEKTKILKRPNKNAIFQGIRMVARVGIEPTTRGFSVRCSTN